MPKIKDKALSLFENNLQTKNRDFQEAFEIRQPQTLNNFSAMFGVAKLTPKEEKEIQQILFLNSQSDTTSDEQVSRDYNALLEITSQIRAIDNQSILLHGERIAKARDIFKSYRQRAISSWMMTVYGNRQTPYSILQYYDFYKSLSKDLQGLIHAMPKKAAYALASRDGNISQKVEIIEKHYEKNQSDLMTIIRETFPLDASDKRKGTDIAADLIDSVRTNLIKILSRKQIITEEDKKSLVNIKHLIEQILS